MSEREQKVDVETEGDFYVRIARQAQHTIERALAGRNRAEVVKRIQAAIDVAEINGGPHAA